MHAADLRRSFITHTEQSAPEASRPMLAGTRRQFGFLPAAVARQAEAPAVLGTFFQLLKTFEATSLTPLEREVIALTVAARNGCELCVELHRRTIERTGCDRTQARALTTSPPNATGNERTDGLAAFVLSAMIHTGDVDPPTWERFLRAGFSRAQALEVLLGIAAYTLSTFANRLVEAPVDLPAQT